ncbi:MAG TPA: class I SAM-dependent methyltransferase [Gaiellaceae bacterium]|jgi:SAM-dependent methyltransferase
MTTAPDGSPVDLYALLPERGEGEIVSRVAPAGSEVLELGCGTGRITRQLLAEGFRVTAVDESAAMLAHVERAKTVLSKIETVDLDRRFPVVLLASNLVNVASEETRLAFLRACSRHVSADGAVVVERLVPGWAPSPERGRLGDIETWIENASVDAGLVSGTVVYKLDDRRWEHEFSMRPLDDQELESALCAAALTVAETLDDRGAWVAARPAE